MDALATTATAPDSSIATDVWAALISGSLLAAVVGALVSIYLARRKSREEQLARVQVMLAEAFQTVADYKEFPYAIRRRRADTPGEERVRLSEEFRRVQSKLTFYVEWTGAEDAIVGDAYSDLVRNLRRVAGKACNEAWATPAIKTDAQMNIPRRQVNLDELAAFERQYAEAAQAYVRDFLKWRKRRTQRRRALVPPQ